MGESRRKLLGKRTGIDLIIALAVSILMYIITRNVPISALIGAVYFLYSLRGLYSYYVRLRHKARKNSAE
jgi:hypothetical protein